MYHFFPKRCAKSNPVAWVSIHVDLQTRNVWYEQFFPVTSSVCPPESMKRTFIAAAAPSTDKLIPLLIVPISATHLSCWTSLRAFCTPTPGSFWSSSANVTTLRPMTPPCAFHLSTAIAIPARSYSPYVA